MDSAYIEVRNLQKKYGTGEAMVYALNDVCLSLQQGELACILGPSGSGKSTLMNILGGIDSADQGTVVVGGTELTGLNRKKLTEYRRQQVGFIFQSYHLISDLTVRENINVVADIAARPLNTDDLIRDIELEKYASHFPGELSGGQQQRTAIARAIVKNPSLLLCDEPTGALDSVTSRKVLEVVERVNRKYHTTVLIITHNEGIAAMADRIIRIRDGRIESNVSNPARLAAAELQL